MIPKHPKNELEPPVQDQLANLPMSIEPLALRPREAARALGVSERLLWQETNRGEIPCVRLGRRLLYPVDGLRRWLDRQADVGTVKGGSK